MPTQVQASGRPAFFMCFPASFGITISQNSATSPLQGLSCTLEQASKVHQKSHQHPSSVSHHPRHDREVERDWHLQKGFQCTAHGSVLSPSTTRFMLSPTPSDGDEHFGVHSSWASCSLTVATALAKAALPKKIRKCTTFPPRRHLVLCPMRFSDPDLESAQLSNVWMSESPFRFMKR